MTESTPIEGLTDFDTRMFRRVESGSCRRSVNVVQKMIAGWLLYLVTAGLGLAASGATPGRNETVRLYRGAVYEHAVYIPWPCIVVQVPRPVAVSFMMLNLGVYTQQAELAAKQGAQILVFPEDGIYGMIFNRKTIKPFLEDIPDPTATSWNPCLLPSNFTNIEVQRSLSCMARHNEIYVVANMGDKKSCDRSTDPKCPDDGQYQYNTDVVFDPTGELVARYHKRNLFKEGQFDKPDLEIATFDTPFGRFGIITCFDILFYRPAVELVKNVYVKNIVFPTAWIDSLPYLAAIQYHSAFSKGLGVTLLSANIHLPTQKFHGSGIYTPNGAVNYYYDDRIVSGGKLLVSDVYADGTGESVPFNRLEDEEKSGVMKMEQNIDFLSIRQPQKDSEQDLSWVRGSYESGRPEYQGQRVSLPRQNYTFVALTNSMGSVHTCQGVVCCQAKYKIDDTASGFFALAAFAGYDDGRYTEICAVLKCPDDTIDSCGDIVRTSNTRFSSLTLVGNFSTPNVFPDVLVTSGETIGIVQGEWSYHQNRLAAERGLSRPLITAALFARNYSKDKNTTQ